VLRNRELIEILQKHDPELPIIVTRDGNACDYGIDVEDVRVQEGAYFGNYDCDEEFDEDQEFLRIALI